MKTNNINNVSFGYHTHIKDCWMAGKLPTVKFDAYGFKLTKKNCTNDHIKPASLGGTLEQGNILLANKWVNNMRGNEPIENYLTKSNLARYLAQFIDVVVEYKNKIFKGNDYINDVLKNTEHIDLKG